MTRDSDPWENDPRWTPKWDYERLTVAIPLQELNKRGLPRIDRLNVLMQDAYQLQVQPFLYPVWRDAETPTFLGVAVADPEWLDDESPEAILNFYQIQGEDGWTVGWHNLGVFEFPFQRVNDCLYQFYQRELDQENETLIPDGLREFPLQFHVVRTSDEDARYPIGLLITSASCENLTPPVVRALYQQLIEERA